MKIYAGPVSALQLQTLTTELSFLGGFVPDAPLDPTKHYLICAPNQARINVFEEQPVIAGTNSLDRRVECYDLARVHRFEIHCRVTYESLKIARAPEGNFRLELHAPLATNGGYYLGQYAMAFFKAVALSWNPAQPLPRLIKEIRQPYQGERFGPAQRFPHCNWGEFLKYLLVDEDLSEPVMAFMVPLAHEAYRLKARRGFPDRLLETCVQLSRAKETFTCTREIREFCDEVLAQANAEMHKALDAPASIAA